MSLFAPSDPRPVHFVGVAGAGMSALAELLVRRGAAVTGCDAHASQADDLRRLGIDVIAGRTIVGVAGTHGKTTTTVMTTEALAAAGLAPTGVAGGRVGAWGGNLRV